MKEVKCIVEKVKYTTIIYDNKEEKENHIIEMEQNGYELLDNFENKHEATYRKFYNKN